MDASCFQTLSPHNIHMLLFFFSFSIWGITKSYASEDDFHYTNCSRPFKCGYRTKNIKYPYWGNGRPGYCGLEGFELGCQDGNYAFMDFNGQRYRVLEIDQTNHVMTVARNDLWDSPCLRDRILNTTMDNGTLFDYPVSVKNLTIFYCSNLDPTLSPPLGRTPCPDRFPYRAAVFVEDEVVDPRLVEHLHLSGCNITIKVPVLQRALEELEQGLSTDWERVLERGFDLGYTVNHQCSGCELSGGICGNNSSYPDSFVCYCSDKPYPKNCSDSVAGNNKNIPVKVGIGIAAAGVTALVLLAVFVFHKYRSRRKPGHSYVVSRSFSSAYSSRTDYEKGGVYCGIPIFDYEELREATNNFDPQKELGDGGFGTVFYGKLQDGRAVAVKRLYENNYKRVEQFMNEVEILARLRHPNLVILYGCTSRQSHRLLLVYEYVPNGTIADHLHGDLAKPGSLPWSTRLSIAVETASALVYLHATDIVHRDVKTNNILLDENFSVKVADFGLSRLFPFNVTHVSTAPQGTPGYVDPEYHQCYQLTDKSDVYSFGVVLVELISSLPAVDITRHRHEINLSNLAINKIHSHALHELVDPNLGFDSNCDTRKMISAVAELAFQCLQQAKDMRPSMADVLNTLKDIQKQGVDGDMNVEEKDDAVLLKDNPLMLSPDSVMTKFSSTLTTPNASG